MSMAPEIALRAIIKALHKSGTFHADDIRFIVRELEDSEKEAGKYDGSAGQRFIRQLCMDIAKDASVSTKFRTAEPDLNVPKSFRD